MTSSKTWTFLVLVIPVVSMAKYVTVHVRTNYKPYEDTWEAFKTQFGRSYSKEEENLRYKAFVDRVQLFERHNQAFLDKKVSFTMDINQFTDRLDTEEWHSCDMEDDKEMVGWSSRFKRQTGFCTLFTPPPQFKPPKSLDWRDRGVVSPVGQQGNCSSCYSFGVTTTIAAQLKLITSETTLTPMSEQQLVDCFRKTCERGSTAEDAFKYISKAGGIMSAKDYPYSKKTQNKGEIGSCAFSASKVKATVQGCRYSMNNETNLMYMVASMGPVYVSIATARSFKNYGSMIYDNPHCESNSTGRHCVTVVGYGTTGTMNYWIIKNSWGAGWGDKGYALMRRGTNVCGIGFRNTVPIVEPAGEEDGRTASVASWPFTISPWPFIIIPLCLALSFATG